VSITVPDAVEPLVELSVADADGPDDIDAHPVKTASSNTERDTNTYFLMKNLPLSR
jgi:hypothetical protein